MQILITVRASFQHKEVSKFSVCERVYNRGLKDACHVCHINKLRTLEF